EFALWAPAEKDSMFDECPDCPKLINELVFVERPEGFRLLDTRLLPTPYSTFTAFIRLLLDNNRTQAARLVKDPAMVSRALAAGWATRRDWRTWVVEDAEPASPWPSWLMVRFRGPHGDHRYGVDFEMYRGRWVIREWADRPLTPDTAKDKTRPSPTPTSGKKKP